MYRQKALGRNRLRYAVQVYAGSVARTVDYMEVNFLDSDPTVIAIVSDITPSEDDEARLDLLLVEDETHFSASQCAD